MDNFFNKLPSELNAEVFEDIINHKSVRIERILSQGQTSPEEGWYDQEEHEWVMVMQGAGMIKFEDGSFAKLQSGDHLNIPARTKHKVSWTDPTQVTVWLAVFYSD